MSDAFPNSPGSPGVNINSPELDPEGKIPSKPPQRAIKDAKQAAQLANKLSNDNEERNLVNARIQSRINAERPFSPKDLENDGLAWKSNFSSQVLAQLIEKVAPRFRTAINSVKYLTNAALPSDESEYPNHREKTERFREEFTNLVRNRPEWQDLTNEISQESCVFGYTAVGWTDEFSWFPKHFRGDRFLIPVGTKQHAENAQIVVLIEHFLPHELFERIQDRETAKDAGWDVANCLSAINNAMPPNLRSKAGDHARVYEDLLRETNVASGFSDGAKMVVAYHLLVREVTGKVSHWIITNPTQVSENPDAGLLFRRYDRFDNMSDAATFFSYQQGNGTMHSSKGIGRLVYNMAQVMERARNEAIDRLQLSGKILLQCDEKYIKRFRMSVIGSAVLIGNAYVASQTKIDGDVEPFITIDQYMTKLLDQLVGNVSPNQIEGERVTAAQVNLLAAREEEAKDNVIARFMLQFANMITTMQRRAFSEDCDEPDAKEARKRLLRYMSEEELDMLRKTASAGVVQDLSELDRQIQILMAQELRGDPLVDQAKVLKMKITAQARKGGSDLAKDLILPTNDPTVAAEQIRMQGMENLMLSLGQTVPVSPRDNHEVHLQTLWPSIQSQLETLVQAPEAAELVKQALDHARQHVQLGTAASGKGGGFEAWTNKIREVEAVLAQLEAHEQAVMAAAEGGLSPEQVVQVGAGEAGAVAAEQSAAATAAPVSPQEAPPQPVAPPMPVQ